MGKPLGFGRRHLGETLDIHAGGIDNAFPHHTNEIAQSESYFGHKWCNYWFHVHHLNTVGGKMSKSKGEFLTVDLLESKGYDPLAYRFFCLQSHYRKSLTFSYEGLDNAAAAYQKLIQRIGALKPGQPQPEEAEQMEALRAGFRQALDNDLNTSLAVTALYDALKASVSDGAKLRLLEEFDRVLSLDLIESARKAAQPQSASLDAQVEALIQQRQQARKDKNFALADQIRDQLKAQGILLEDTPQGVKWSIQK